MKQLAYLFLFLSSQAQADTIDHYINIANNIPQMEMKADPQAQAWARSARNILVLTSESIIESLTLANETAKQHGSPLFCLPGGAPLSGEKINDLIQQTYKELYNQQNDKDKMTVSQVVLIGLAKQYPCTQQDNHATNQMMHMSNSTKQANSN